MMFNTQKTYRNSQHLMRERMAEAEQHALARTNRKSQSHLLSNRVMAVLTLRLRLLGRGQKPQAQAHIQRAHS